jgi:hypothetical protein
MLHVEIYWVLQSSLKSICLYIYIYSVIEKESVSDKKIEFFQKRKKRKECDTCKSIIIYTPFVYYIYRYESQKKIHKE